MSDFCIILWTANNFDEAKEIISFLLDKRIIACATLLDNAHSMYIWKDKVESQKETQVIIKSLKSKFSEIKEIINKNSSYEVSEILQIEINDGLSSYLNWIKEVTS